MQSSALEKILEARGIEVSTLGDQTAHAQHILPHNRVMQGLDVDEAARARIGAYVTV